MKNLHISEIMEYIAANRCSRWTFRLETRGGDIEVPRDVVAQQ